jgi:hypothetical protein
MKDQHRGRHGGRLATCLMAIVGSTLVLGGCGDRSVSGSYVSHAGNQADLLQITETPDHHFTGTIRHTGLNNDGTLSSSSTNVSGSVDGNSITLTVLATPLPIGQNFSGSVTGDGIDLTVANGAQTGVEHFTKGQPSDFDAVVVLLNQASRSSPRANGVNASIRSTAKSTPSPTASIASSRARTSISNACPGPRPTTTTQ